VAAFLLLQKAGQYLPGDPQLADIAGDLTHVASVKSSPPGASVEIKDYLSPADPWFPLGTTPLENIRIPTGYLRWKVSKTGVGEISGAPISEDIHGPRPEFNFALEAAAKAPQGMVPVPGVKFEDYVWSLGPLGPYDLPLFYIDRFEVTNRQYQDFVDQGGYQKRELWKEKFIRDGKELSWEQAMALFRDSTGRPGPSTWEAGHYPSGQADYPVGGVSWYEAAAYAEFAGKSLPVIAQWYLAAPSPIAKYITPQSNFSLSALAPVGKYQGIGPWGTYDMAGNVAEWCRNEDRGSRYILGGAWNTSSAEYHEPGTLPPFDRSANSGFRCVRNTAALPAAAAAEVPAMVRDFSKAKPAPDAVFRIYKAMYAYDRTPLNAKVESIENSADWRKEKITFDAAYGNERMAAYLFVPANLRPPYQTVVFFPSARVLDIPVSKTLGDMKFVDYVIKSGRAVLYPVYKGTYERPAQPGLATTAGREVLIQESKDLGRSIDYLETRTDIDRNRIGYLGVSMGAALGVILTAVEDRLKAVVLLDGGFFDEKVLPGTDQADFAPRIKAPALMIGGKYDWVLGGKDALFRMLGTPAADKKAVTFDTAHDVSEQRADLVREVVAWLDKYLGKVN
jgi:formylglycine-generating enzyme required for sulfatase activity/dienelactone hydrolase